jgi:hypothetical protein
MVKTTIILDDRLYKRLVNEAIEEYGSTRKLSLLINRKLKQAECVVKKPKQRKITVKLGHKLTEKELEKAIDEGWDEAIRWTA